MDCKDSATDMMGVNATDSDRNQATVTMEKCLVKCVDTNLQSIPKLFKRITDTIAKQSK